MENFVKQFLEQEQYLESLVRLVDARRKECQIPDEYKIWVTNQKNGFQYYEVDNTGRREYIKKSDLDRARAIVQRDYDDAVMKTLLDMRYRLQRFLKLYDPDAVKKVYEKLCNARKALVEPIIPTDEEFVRSWKETHVGGQNSYPASVSYLTGQGERVRSKSEKILADLFWQNNIPYCYEPQLRLKNGKDIYPDFVLLNIRTRKTYYWEHFGLASDEEYAAHALQKLQAYENSGLEIGREVLFSVESPKMPLDLKLVEEKLKRHLL